MADKKTQIIISAKDETRQAFNSVTASLKGLENLAAKSVAGLAYGLSAGTIIDFGKTAVNAAKDAEIAFGRMQATLKATGYSAGFVASDLESIADKLAGLTQFDDDAFQNAEANFIKFGNIQSGVFERGLKLSADLAAFLGNDLPDSADQLGKALSSPEDGLGRLAKSLGGLTKAQEESIQKSVENGRVMEAQGKILDIVESKIGGTAATLNTGLNKALSDSTKQWDEFMEAVGKLPAVQRAATAALNLLSPGTITTKLLDPNFKGISVGPDVKKAMEFTFAPTINDEAFLKAQAKAAELFKKMQLESEAQQKIKSDADKKMAADSEKIYEQKLTFFKSEREAMAGLITDSLKLNEADKSAIDLIQERLDAYSVLDPAIRAFTQSQIDLARATEAATAFEAAFAKGFDNETDALNAAAEADQLFADQRDQTYWDMYVKIRQGNEDLNIDLIKSDTERAKAQLDIDHQRNIERIQNMRLTTDQVNDLLDQEDENYRLRSKKITEGTKDDFKDLQRAIEGFGKQSADAFVEFSFGAKTSVDDLVQSVLKDLAKLAIYKGVTQPIFDSISTIFSGDGSGGASGFPGLITNLFGGGKAVGGAVNPSQFYMVGEKGPELFIPSSAGTIIPNNKLSSGDGLVIHNINVTTSGSNVDADGSQATQLGGMIASAVQSVLIKEKRAGGLLA